MQDRRGALNALLMQPAEGHGQPIPYELRHPVLARGELIEKLIARADHQFGRGDGVGTRRSATKSAMVKSVSWPMAEITGHALGRDGSGDVLFVEGPQILERTAARAPGSRRLASPTG